MAVVKEVGTEGIANQIVKRGDNGYNIPVKYNSGKSVMGRDYILQPGTDYSVYAAYPEKNSSDVMTLPLETASQTDYLYGCAVNGNGEQAVINQSNHVAKIQLSHALALLRFNISQSAENHEQNKVHPISGIAPCAPLRQSDTLFRRVRHWPPDDSAGESQ